LLDACVHAHWSALGIDDHKDDAAAKTDGLLARAGSPRKRSTSQR
jgi:hypothetical protein